ncbi:MAG: GNAT family N-acetyltransferase [Bacillota bacterium]
MELHSDRIKLYAPTPDEFLLSLTDPNYFARQMGWKEDWSWMEQSVKETLMQGCRQAIKDKENYLWYTNWLIILKEENAIVGGITFKGPSNSEGEVEIGYEMNPEYRNKGLMKETVELISSWVLGNPEVQRIIAETNKDNIPSGKVLAGTGFSQYRLNNLSIYWQRSKVMT